MPIYKIVVTAGIMLGLFMASMEATVIATAMPTIVSQLGGLAIYSWAFSAYMLTSTTTVPVYGKLSDLYGRRNVFAVAMGIFLVGSVACGQARTMEQLIWFRALQGLGAGGVLPLVFIIVGDLFALEQRARMQGFLAGVWGVSSIVGPLLGGFLVDQISWHWVFYVNVFPGVLAVAMVWFAWREESLNERVISVDYAGAILLMGGVVLLLLGLLEIGTVRSTSLLIAAVALLLALLWVERRSADPILPLTLFRQRLFSVGTAHGLLTGWAMFGSLSFVPLFVQSVLGTTATGAGSTLTPMLLGWVLASIFGSRLLLRLSYRSLALAGTASLTIGAFLMSQADVNASRPELMFYLGLMGIGMGLSIPPFLIAIQSTVGKRSMGTATSTLQFSRNIGGTLGVSVMGAFLAMRLSFALTASGLDPNAVSINSLLEPGSTSAGMANSESLRAAMAFAVSGVFTLAFVAAALALAIVFLSPRGRIAQLAEASQPTPPPPATQPAVADLSPET